MESHPLIDSAIQTAHRRGLSFFANSVSSLNQHSLFFMEDVFIISDALHFHLLLQAILCMLSYNIMQKFIIGLAIFRLCGFALSYRDFPFYGYQSCDKGNWVCFNPTFVNVTVPRLMICTFNSAMRGGTAMLYLYNNRQQPGDCGV